MLSKEFIEQLIETAERTIQEAITAIYEYQKEKTYIPTYYKYPKFFLEGIEEHESYKEMEVNIPAFKCGIKFLTDSTYQSPANYGELLRSCDGQFQINCHGLEHFDKLLQLFKSVPDASKPLASEEKYIDSSIITHIPLNVVSRNGIKIPYNTKRILVFCVEYFPISLKREVMKWLIQVL